MYNDLSEHLCGKPAEKGTKIWQTNKKHWKPH